MADEKIRGAADVLFIHDGTAYLPFGCLTSNSTEETVDTTTGTVTKCDPNPAPDLGAYSYTKSFEAEAVSNTTTKASLEKVRTIMREKAASKQPVFWKEEITFQGTGSTKVTEYGKAFLTNLSIEAPADGMVTFSGELQGIGQISQTDLVTV